MILASWRLLASIVKRCEVILEVLDVRDPVSTRSRKLERMVEKENKKLILVLNKCDLIPRHVAEKWKRIFSGEGYTTVYMAARDHKGTRVLRRTIKMIAPSLPTVVGVVGFPKTGKSTVINALKGRHSATTSSIPGSPGYTKKAQLYRVDRNIYMIDTPGIIPIEGGPLEAVIRGKPPEQLDDPVKPAMMLLEKALKYNPYCVLEAYGVKEKDPLKILEAIARHRGWFYKTTGEPLIEEAAKCVIRDYHEGKLLFYIPPEEYIALKKKKS